MAELNTQAAGGRNTKGRKNRILPRVDMTPMVDLMFLLITFFMLTTSLLKPSALVLAMPVDGPEGPVAETRTLNICMGKNDRLLYYMGNDNRPLTDIKQIDTKDKAIRKLLLKQKQLVAANQANRGKNMMVLIKPSDASVYQNLVDVIDELKLCGIEHYAVVKNTAKDIERLKSQHIY